MSLAFPGGGTDSMMMFRTTLVLWTNSVLNPFSAKPMFGRIFFFLGNFIYILYIFHSFFLFLFFSQVIELFHRTMKRNRKCS